MINPRDTVRALIVKKGRTRQAFNNYSWFISLILLLAFGGIVGLSVYLAVKKS